jgi:serine/threonine-protein kinase RsbW
MAEPLEASHPSLPTVEVRRWVLDDPLQLRELRASVHETLTGRPWTAGATLGDVPEKVMIVATELATNALRHGLPPTVVRLCRAGGHYVLDVADQDPTVPPEYAAARPADAGGLGLQLAARLALDIGWYVGDGTKHVWAEFPDPSA